jgi:putative DNA methylase
MQRGRKTSRDRRTYPIDRDAVVIPKECKRLAEVDFPIAEVSRHSAREKSIRHGHPSTLHLWWARRPLAACRAILLALLLPDPADPHCPEDFKGRARAVLRPPLPQPKGKTDLDLRQALLRFIADFANWDAAAEPVFLEAARSLVKAAHGQEPPLVVDPFAGGGSIPLETLRLGCDAFASDLNPVACLILKVLLEDIPRHGPSLASELRRIGAETKAGAEKELAEFYPADPDGARPIAYLWARTVRCESSGCGAEIPLVRSLWLSKKAKRPRALRYRIERPEGRPPEVVFEVFEPRTDSEVPRGTVSRAKAACQACGIVLAPERVRGQLSAQRGGADVAFDLQGRRTGGARLLAVVTLQAEERGRRYRIPTEADYRAVWCAQQALEEKVGESLQGSLSPVPDEPLPPVGTLGFRVQRYGMLCWGDLFAARQKLALLTGSQVAIEAASRVLSEQLTMFDRCWALAFDRWVSYMSAQCMWVNAAKMEAISNIYSRHALPVVWDFGEISPFADVSGSLRSAVEWVALVAEGGISVARAGQAHLADACELPLADESASVWFTDPPYYDAVPYADLSDFFLVWLKRILPNHPLLRDPFDPTNSLTPKDREAVQDHTRCVDGRPKDRGFFEDVMGQAFAEGARMLRDDGIGAVVFAHKTTEGWEALLSGMIRGGWVITASWPIATERPGRLRAQESAALSASVHLVCRPRDENVPPGDWGDVFAALPGRVAEWMEKLSNEGVRGADLVFACIGPALELFSRYPKVELPDGEVVGLGANPGARGEPARRGYLSYVWEVVGRAALAQVLGTETPGTRNGGASVLEEDARLTALFLWTIQSTSIAEIGEDDGDEDDQEPEPDEEEESGRPSRKKGLVLIYDVVRRFAQPLGIHLDQWERRIVETEKGVVRLLPVRERAGQLFGEDGASAVAQRIESTVRAGRASAQGTLFPELAETPPAAVKGRRKGRGVRKAEDAEQAEPRRDATTLDRIHAAMLFQACGASSALRALLESEIERGSDFLRLANALSALYPKDSEEKRLLDAMLLAVPR